MASSRMAMVAMVLFLVCTLVVARKMEAGRTTQRGEVLVDNGGGGGGNTPQHVFVGHRPRRDEEVGPPSTSQGAGGDGEKREVPGGPDPIHHHGSGSVPPSAVAP
ncbi:unnamed protein product [Alopecurus aequalis]